MLIQAVTQKNLQQTGAVFYTSGELVINANLKVSVDKPRVLLIDWSTMPIKVMVSDINQNQTAMNVTLTYSNQSSEVLGFSFPQGNLKGSSVSKNSTATPSLPVKLISFNGTATNNGAVLNWKTTSETDLSHYVIQHSTNGLVFEDLSLVAAKNSAGVFNYNFTDDNARFGVNYCRLLSVDIDGETSLSEPLAVTFGGEILVVAYPNPTKNKLNIDALNMGDRITVSGLDGVILRTDQHKNNSQTATIDLSSLKPAVCILTVQRDGKSIYTTKIVKED